MFLPRCFRFNLVVPLVLAVMAGPGFAIDTALEASFLNPPTGTVNKPASPASGTPVPDALRPSPVCSSANALSFDWIFNGKPGTAIALEGGRLVGDAQLPPEERGTWSSSSQMVPETRCCPPVC